MKQRWDPWPRLFPRPLDPRTAPLSHPRPLDLPRKAPLFSETDPRDPRAASSSPLFSPKMTEMMPESELYTKLKGTKPFFLLAGPNVIQSEEHIFKMCRYIKSVTDDLGIEYVFKSSFDKFNRTNVKSFRGPGLEEGLKVLDKVKHAFDVPIVTDIHEPWQAEPVAKVLPPPLSLSLSVLALSSRR